MLCNIVVVTVFGVYSDIGIQNGNSVVFVVVVFWRFWTSGFGSTVDRLLKHLEDLYSLNLL